MNIVNLTGRWSQDFKVSDVGGKKKATGSIAVDKFGKDAGASFFQVEAWEKTAEVLEKYASKGDFAIVTGELVQDTWEKDGQKQSKVYIKVSRIDLPPKGDKSSQATSEPKAKSSKPSPVEEDEEDPLF